MKRAAAIIFAAILTSVCVISASASSRYASPGNVSFWYVLADAVGDPNNELDIYAAETAGIISGEVPKPELLRHAAVCRALGICPEFVESVVRDDSLDSVSNIIWRLLIADETDAERLCGKLTECKNPDGGWAIGAGRESDPDVTAMAVSALAAHGVVDHEALAFLSDAQSENGCWSSFGVENCESTAQVVVALCTAGIDPRADERFIKNGISAAAALEKFKTDDGYSHIRGGAKNELATAQVYFAETAMRLFESGRSIFEFSYKADISAVSAEPAATEGKIRLGAKAVAAIVLALITLSVFAVLIVRKKANAKNLVTLLIFVAVSAGVILFVNIQSVDEYYSENPDPIYPDTVTVALCVRDGDRVMIEEVLAMREGETALSLLLRSAKYARVRVDTSGEYVRGIDGLYEFDRGPMSGWKFRVNGIEADVSAGAVRLNGNDTVEWFYYNGN